MVLSDLNFNWKSNILNVRTCFLKLQIHIVNVKIPKRLETVKKLYW